MRWPHLNLKMHLILREIRPDLWSSRRLVLYLGVLTQNFRQGTKKHIEKIQFRLEKGLILTFLRLKKDHFHLYFTNGGGPPHVRDDDIFSFVWNMF